MASLIGIIILLAILAGFAGFIVLQVKLSKKEATMPGLILPIISFVFALVVVLSLFQFMLFNTVSYSSVSESIGYYDEDGNFVVETEKTEYYDDMEEYQNYEETTTIGFSRIGLVISVVMNLTPTVVFLVIYFACHPFKKRKEKNTKQTELDKMSISDL